MNTSTPFKPHGNSFAWFRPQALSLGTSECKNKIRDLRKQYPRHYPEAFQFIRECLTLSESRQKQQEDMILTEQAKPEDERRDIAPVSSNAVAYLLAALQGLIESYAFVQTAMFPHETRSHDDGDEMIADLARDTFKVAKYLAEELLDVEGQSTHEYACAEAIALHVLLGFENRQTLELCPDELLELLADWQMFLARVRRQMAVELEAKAKAKRQRRVELNSSRKQYYNATAVIWNDLLEQVTAKLQLIDAMRQPICCAYDLPIKATSSDERARVLHLRFNALVEKQVEKPSYDAGINLELLAQYIWDNCHRKMLNPGTGMDEICHDRVWVGMVTCVLNGTKLNLFDPRISLWTTWEGEDYSSKEERDWHLKEADPNPFVLDFVEHSYEKTITALPLDEEGRLEVSPGREIHMLVESGKRMSFYLPTEFFDLAESREVDKNTLLVFRTRSACMRGWRSDKLIFVDSDNNDTRYEVPITVEGIYKVDLSF